MVFVPIPGFERYLISQNGTVLDTVSEEIIRNQGDVYINTKVKLLYQNRTDRFRSISVARLILITHKPIVGVNLDVVWGPKLRTSSQDQVTSSNLDYDFGEYVPPIPVTDHEFHLVPGFIDTEINLNGVVRMSGKEVKIGQQRGYAVASARLPNGISVTVGRHRLLALTFLKRPNNCSDLIVNHIDGKPSQDSIVNLEWVTYQGNMTHAHENKLVTNHIPVEVKNLSTGEVREFFSIGAFSREYDLNSRDSKRLEFRMNVYGVANDYRGLAIRKKNPGISWDHIPSLDGYRGNAKEVSVRENSTGRVTEFIWFKDASDFLGVSQFRLRNSLRKFGEVSIGDYIVTYASPSILAGKSSLVK